MASQVWLVEKNDLFVLLQGMVLSMRSDTLGDGCEAFRRCVAGMEPSQRHDLTLLVRREIVRWQAEGSDGNLLAYPTWRALLSELEVA